MKVTKSIAEDVASKMVQSKVEEIKELKGQLSKLASDFMWGKVPESVAVVFEAHPEYVKSEGSATFHGLGLNYKAVRFVGDIPKADYRYYLQSDKKDDVQFSDKAVKLINEIEKIEDAKNQLETSIYNALITLGTVKRCVESFPECAKFMPKDEKFMPPSVNLEKIRELLWIQEMFLYLALSDVEIIKKTIVSSCILIAFRRG